MDAAPMTDDEIDALVRRQTRHVQRALDLLTEGYWLQAYEELRRAKDIDERL